MTRDRFFKQLAERCGLDVSVLLSLETEMHARDERKPGRKAISEAAYRMADHHYDDCIEEDGSPVQGSPAQPADACVCRGNRKCRYCHAIDSAW